MSALIHKYLMNEETSKEELNHLIYQFTGAKDDIDDVMQKAIDTFGDDPVIRKSLIKYSSVLEKAIKAVEKQIIDPMKKRYK